MTRQKAIPKHGTMRVWWVPQIPMKPFMVDVRNLAEAKLLLDALAEYDLFQLENNIKPDFSNAGGLEIWDDELDEDEDGSKWTAWYSDEGEEIDRYDIATLRTNPPKWEHD